MVPGLVCAGWCRGGGAAECVSASQLEQALADLSSEVETTREQAVALLIERGDASLLPRLEELRANADRSLRMAIKPVIDTWRNRTNLASPDSDTRRTPLQISA